MKRIEAVELGGRQHILDGGSAAARGKLLAAYTILPILLR